MLDSAALAEILPAAAKLVPGSSRCTINNKILQTTVLAQLGAPRHTNLFLILWFANDKKRALV